MIERGDEVYHKPSGEDWVVARAGVDGEGEYVEPAGYPPCRARAADCILTKKGAHIAILNAAALVQEGE